MICAVLGVTTNDWLKKPELFGQLIESYTFQQVITQLGWVDDNVEYYHFRDQKKREVDLVLQRHDEIWGIEMKRATNISIQDYQGLKILASIAGENWKGGIIFYSGEHVLSGPLENTFAVPYGALWDGFDMDAH